MPRNAAEFTSATGAGKHVPFNNDDNHADRSDYLLGSEESQAGGLNIASGLGRCLCTQSPNVMVQERQVRLSIIVLAIRRSDV